jgi:hypothetical protein
MVKKCSKKIKQKVRDVFCVISGDFSYIINYVKMDYYSGKLYLSIFSGKIEEKR